MRFRQIHLDFHTSEKIPGVGSAFNAKQFQDMLTVGHVDSITIFSKCHHGWSYHPTTVGRQHPTLGFDLLNLENAVGSRRNAVNICHVIRSASFATSPIW